MLLAVQRALRPHPLAYAARLALAVPLIGTAAALQAQTTNLQATSLAQVEALEEVTVTATRTTRAVDDIAANVSVTSGEDARARGAQSIRDFFVDQPDLSVRQAPSRFSVQSGMGRAGAESINVRGLEGNRVAMVVDGIRLPYSFSFQSFSTGRGAYLDAAGLARADVLRGPASTQVGSGGLAGGVNFQTTQASDLLEAGDDQAGLLELGYHGVDDSTRVGLSLAARRGAWDVLAIGALTQGHETENNALTGGTGATRTLANPADSDQRYLLGKIGHSQGSHRFELAAESLQRDLDTDVLSNRGAVLGPNTTLAFLAQDRTERDRVSVRHIFDEPGAAWIDRIESQIYWQDALVRQFTFEDRSPGVDRTRDNRYREDLFGFNTQAEKTLLTSLPQRLSAGLDWSRTDVSAVRDGTVPPAGETYPAVVFPDTRYTQLGIFGQNEIDAGSWSVIPAVRYDRFVLDPKGSGNRLSDSAWSPRLGVIWRASEQFAPYANLATGFRAPTPNEVNERFENLTSPFGSYRTISNPNLRAETSRTLELGARGQLGDALRYQISVHDSDYKDFISRQLISGTGTMANPQVFQYINLSDARIRGGELRLDWQASPAWRFSGALAWAEGTTTTAQGVSSPLNTINPTRLVAAADYEAADWSMRIALTHAWAVSQSRVPVIRAQNGNLQAGFVAPSYTTLDLSTQWRITAALTLNAGINNLTDERYWLASDVRDLAASAGGLDAYTAPGRHGFINLQYRF